MTPGRADRLYLGWQHATPYPEPGPPPRRPTPPDSQRLAGDWVAAQRREEHLLNRPLRAGLIAAVAIAAVAAVLAAAGWLAVLVAGLVVVCCVLIAAVSGYAIWQGERALRCRLAGERERAGGLRATQESRLFARQAEHASQVRQWQALRVAYQRQKRWYAVCAPSGIYRADVAGGTLAGWSALLSTAGAQRLAAGGQVTVLDLSGGSVALDLIALARTSGVEPLVLTLPGDPVPVNPVAAGGGTPPRRPLRVLALDQRAEVQDQAFDNYLAVMLTQLPQDARRGSPWQYTLFVFGADRLRGDVIDRLCDACDAQGTGLVLAYYAMPAHVRHRPGSGNAVLALMRPANAQDAEEISERLGTEHHLVLAQQHELEHLPASAMIVSYPSPAGRQVVMVDADPGIGGLGSATMLTLEEFRAMPATAADPAAAGAHAAPHSGKGRTAPVSWRAGGNRPPPNLDPPPRRLDWRKRPGA
ncbi:MAG: hypothetical protein ACRDPY_07395 [Streptosporangiaceae bacterium]